MRTTLILDDDLGRQIDEEARRTGRSFGDIINESLRRGLIVGPRSLSRPPRFRVRPKAWGFQPGIDPRKLNRIGDEIDT
jgi:hypothetical protein